jgi:hypothetical protein
MAAAYRQPGPVANDVVDDARLAIRLSCSAVASSYHCQASLGGCGKFRRSTVSSLGHDSPSDSRHLVGHRNGDKLGSLLGQATSTPEFAATQRLASSKYYYDSTTGAA